VFLSAKMCLAVDSAHKSLLMHIVQLILLAGSWLAGALHVAATVLLGPWPYEAPRIHIALAAEHGEEQTLLLQSLPTVVTAASMYMYAYHLLQSNCCACTCRMLAYMRNSLTVGW
jgi:hypothetical protein